MTGLRIAELADALDYLAGVIAGPVTEPLPDLREAWHGMACRHDRRVPVDVTEHLTDHTTCRCDYCRWHVRNAPIVANWGVAQTHRPHRRYELPYGSVNAAVADLLRHRLDGASVRSSAATVGDRARAISALGASVQATTRHGDTPSERRVDSALDVERCARVAAARVATSAAPTAMALSVLVASVGGIVPEDWAADAGMTLRAAESLVRRVRRAATVELAARGLVPMPRPQARLDREIAQRCAELDVGVAEGGAK